MCVASVNQNVITCNRLFLNKWISLYDMYILLCAYVAKSWLLFLVLTNTSLKIFINLSCFITPAVYKVNHFLMSEEAAYSSFDMHAWPIIPKKTPRLCLE